MDIYKEYESWLIGDGKSEHTVTGYVRDLKLFAKWYEDSTGDKMEITKINQIDVAEYRNYLMQRSSANTVNRKIAVVKNFLDFGIYTGKIEHNAAERIKRAKTVKQHQGTNQCRPANFETGIRRRRDPMHSALFALMIHTSVCG